MTTLNCPPTVAATLPCVAARAAAAILEDPTAAAVDTFAGFPPDADDANGVVGGGFGEAFHDV